MYHHFGNLDYGLGYRFCIAKNSLGLLFCDTLPQTDNLDNGLGNRFCIASLGGF